MLTARVAGAMPALATVSEITALPAQMHCEPMGQRLSSTRAAKVTVRPGPDTVTGWPRPRVNDWPSVTVRAPAVVGGEVVGMPVAARVVVGRGLVVVGRATVVASRVDEVVVATVVGADAGKLDGSVVDFVSVDGPSSPQPASARSATTLIAARTRCTEPPSAAQPPMPRYQAVCGYLTNASKRATTFLGGLTQSRRCLGS